MQKIQIPEMAEFRAWLARVPGDTIVGERRSPCSCPAAHWLVDVTGEPVGVTVDGVIDMNASLEDPPVAPVPDWLHDFVVMVDEYDRGDCTAESCLAIIDHWS